jgi:hypothetical protein
MRIATTGEINAGLVEMIRLLNKADETEDIVQVTYRRRAGTRRACRKTRMVVGEDERVCLSTDRWFVST